MISSFIFWYNVSYRYLTFRKKYIMFCTSPKHLHGSKVLGLPKYFTSVIQKLYDSIHVGDLTCSLSIPCKAPFTWHKKVYSKMPGQNASTTFYAVFHTILILHLLFYGVKNQLSRHSVRAFRNRLLCSVNGPLLSRRW